MSKQSPPPVDSPARLRRMSAISALFAATLALAACGGSSGGDSGPPGQPNAPAPAPAPAPEQEPELEQPPAPPPANLPSGAPSAPAAPPSTQLPSGIDMSNPGVVIKPAAATASASNGANGPEKAFDGDLTTRWESARVDDAWLRFDFGKPTPIGYMKLTWEAAYGKEYAIEISEDGQNWFHLRHVVGGKGGVEEFYNLNANVQYVRIKGIQRATQYGYSLFEVEFKSPGTDNSLFPKATSVIPFPANGNDLAAPGPVVPPLETVQFQLPDGRLVTRFGMVGRSRHARERGEDWAEKGGTGENQTMAGGQPVDKGPGAHLNFVANYFKNRTWGVEFIDDSLVPGVTKPSIVVNQYYQQKQRGGGHSFVRRFDDINVTGFGWMSPGDLLDDGKYNANDAVCDIIPRPPQTSLMTPGVGYAGVKGANDGCSVVFDEYPRHGKMVTNADGVMVSNGETVPSRNLVVGDAIEFTGSFFSTPAAMQAIGDNGAVRYYTNEVTYVVGVGLRPWRGVQPRLMNEPLPAEVLQGGIGSIGYDYADNSAFMFQQPFNNIGMWNMQRFVEGRRWVHTNMWTGDHNENGNDRNTAAVKLQGPRFNQSTCFGCHINNGRSLAPSVLNQRLDTMAVRTAAIDGNGHQVPHPIYGQAAQMNARSPVTGALQDWGTGVRVAGFQKTTVTLNDGTPVELSKPIIAFDGPTPAAFSLRNAQPMIGMGLLEAIDDSVIIGLAKPQADADGVKGTVNYVYDPETKQVKVGRYGWKASKVSLRHQAAAAALLDMSVTSPVYPNRGCLMGPDQCDKTKPEAGLTEESLTLITRYLGLLGVPAQRSLTSGFPKGVAPLPALDVNPTLIAAGAKVFERTKCVACHVSQLKTGLRAELAEAREQTIKPYTNLLLHDMGPELEDNLIEGQATGRMWRTPALWGIGYTERVAGDNKVGYLHDGRARNLTEAIMWHGGEGNTSRTLFKALNKADRDALLAFLGSL